ncbi:1,4-dihydroxy-2-naphthoate polyprenyltransferase [Aeromicrobium sp. 636]|nr:1,4-dihydroxy-2-naphthoate polyprenyltransferase [Aeromicrobium senzhongii]MCQ3999436.1 1,4-dihydroxy-2-naphthoate polyprenyltransferase [Aeromicrobium sp. 636]MTB88252.1 1,4-dihydroxy-2-naphthoate polyprenyltransferase [Aeromicrobium senzhongii]
MNLWIEGARLRTLPAAIAPVAVGTGAAAFDDGAVWWKALLALGVSLALQIGVNYANDYSDGIKGTDENRVGPLRLVGSGLVAPEKVKAAAFGFLGLGGLLGLVLAATSGWWLIAVGVLAILAAWGYTGGKNPYGYRALGEVSVFVFFGLVAVLGTTYVQLGHVNAVSVAGAIGVGALACAILVANNLRDIPTDTETGKRTLAVLLGDQRTRWFYIALVMVAFVIVVAWCATVTPWALLAWIGMPAAGRAAAMVRTGAAGPALIPVLKDTGMGELLYAVGLTVGLFIGPV